MQATTRPLLTTREEMPSTREEIIKVTVNQLIEMKNRVHPSLNFAPNACGPFNFYPGKMSNDEKERLLLSVRHGTVYYNIPVCTDHADNTIQFICGYDIVTTLCKYRSILADTHPDHAVNFGSVEVQLQNETWNRDDVPLEEQGEIAKSCTYYTRRITTLGEKIMLDGQKFFLDCNRYMKTDPDGQMIQRKFDDVNRGPEYLPFLVRLQLILREALSRQYYEKDFRNIKYKNFSHQQILDQLSKCPRVDPLVKIVATAYCKTLMMETRNKRPYQQKTYLSIGLFLSLPFMRNSTMNVDGDIDVDAPAFAQAQRQMEQMQKFLDHRPDSVKTMGELLCPSSSNVPLCCLQACNKFQAWQWKPIDQFLAHRDLVIAPWRKNLHLQAAHVGMYRALRPVLSNMTPPLSRKEFFRRVKKEMRTYPIERRSSGKPFTDVDNEYSERTAEKHRALCRAAATIVRRPIRIVSERPLATGMIDHADPDDCTYTDDELLTVVNPCAMDTGAGGDAENAVARDPVWIAFHTIDNCYRGVEPRRRRRR